MWDHNGDLKLKYNQNAHKLVKIFIKVTQQNDQ